MKASIIIVTRNRAADLAETLRSMRGLRVPDGLKAEALVVDNGSTDDTRKVVEHGQLPHLPLSYACESRPGLSYGRNLGLARTEGDFILFTDDDVRLPPDWISGMCAPFVEQKSHVVAGGVRIAPHLLRPWMTKVHRSFLASSEWLDPASPHNVVGANMAFSRELLRRVPGFDVELGAGRLGFGDEELFALQLRKAGYEIFGRLEVEVEHHFQPSRLLRSAWVEGAAKRGKVNAYLTYHWHHRGYKLAPMRLLWAQAQLGAWRARHGRKRSDTEEGCAEREMTLIFRCAELRYYLQECRPPRNYERFGLAKRSGTCPGRPEIEPVTSLASRQ